MKLESQGHKLLDKIQISENDREFLKSINEEVLKQISEKVKTITIIKDDLRKDRNLKTIERAAIKAGKGELIVDQVEDMAD